MTTLSQPTAGAVPAVLLWPPPAVSFDGERVNIFDLIPPNRYDDFSLPSRESHVAGVTLRADRVILDRERYPDCERSTQHKLSDDIQASCREQGYWISVKEWADKNQHRGTLRLRLRCRCSSCRFQFQLNWDSKAGFWYISRRRCGTFTHTCQPIAGEVDMINAVHANHGSAKRKVHEGQGPPSKRARVSPDITESTSAFGKLSPVPSHPSNETQASKNIDHAEMNETSDNLLDSARSLLDLAKAGTVNEAPKSPVPSKPKPEAPQTPLSNESKSHPVASVISPPPSQSVVPVRIGDRIYLASPQGSNFLSTSGLPMFQGGLHVASALSNGGLTAEQKLAILQGSQGYGAGAGSSSFLNDPLVKAALQKGYPSFHNHGQSTQAILQMDPSFLQKRVFLNGSMLNM